MEAGNAAPKSWEEWALHVGKKGVYTDIDILKVASQVLRKKHCHLRVAE